MKQKIYSPSNTPTINRRQPSISFNLQGLIRISSQASRELGLLPEKGKMTKKLLFIQDEEHPRDWYLKPVGQDVADAFTIHHRNGNTMLNSVNLCSVIWEVWPSKAMSTSRYRRIPKTASSPSSLPHLRNRLFPSTPPGTDKGGTLLTTGCFPS